MGCSGNIFMLSFMIQIHVRVKLRKIFAAHIDFKRAFDTVNHSILWAKLSLIGLSSKIVRA